MHFCTVKVKYKVRIFHLKMHKNAFGDRSLLRLDGGKLPEVDLWLE